MGERKTTIPSTRRAKLIAEDNEENESEHVSISSFPGREEKRCAKKRRIRSAQEMTSCVDIGVRVRFMVSEC